MGLSYGVILHYYQLFSFANFGFLLLNLTRITKFKYEKKKNDEIILVPVVKHFIAQMAYYNDNYFFLSLRAGGILQILQSGWFRELYRHRNDPHHRNDRHRNDLQSPPK